MTYIPGIPLDAQNQPGFRAGPICRVCQKHRADEHQTICFTCQSAFKRADTMASNLAGIRADMACEGLLYLRGRDFRAVRGEPKYTWVRSKPRRHKR